VHLRGEAQAGAWGMGHENKCVHLAVARQSLAPLKRAADQVQALERRLNGAQFCAHHQTLPIATNCWRSGASPLFMHT